MLYFFIFLLCIIFSLYILITKINAFYLQTLRDKAAREVVGQFDFKKDIYEIKKITQSFYSLKSNICPECDAELFLQKKGFVELFRCSNYLKCDFQRSKKPYGLLRR